MILDRLQNLLIAWISKKSFLNSQEMYLSMLLTVTNTTILVIYLFLLVFFLWAGMGSFAFLGLINSIINAVCYYIIRKRRFAATGFILTAQVTIHLVLCTYGFGLAHNALMYIFPILLMQHIVPYTSVRIRGGLVVALLIISFLCAALLYSHPPVYPLEERAAFISVVNVVVSLAATSVGMSVGSLVKKVISAHREVQLSLFKKQAHTDPLTGLYNRRYAEIYFNEIRCAGGENEWCIAMLDIDDFKQINDSYGHQAGDEILFAVSRLIKKCLRKTDVVFRWGGEELLLLKDVDKDTAYEILDKLRATLEDETLYFNGNQARVTVTVGVTSLNLKNVAQSIEQCDKKMYAGKRSGKNRIVV